MTEARATYLFDPLCGWCYAVAPAIARLAESGALAITPLPVGLFAGPGARPMSADFAAYAWSNDQRIAALTGQPFSEAYRRDVLGPQGGAFDSGPATRLLTWVAGQRPDLELPCMARLQKARFVGGRDLTDPAVLGSVAADLELDRVAAERAVADDPTLAAATEDRIGRGGALMTRLHLGGVPALVLHGPAGDRVVDTRALLGDPAALLAAFAAD